MSGDPWNLLLPRLPPAATSGLEIYAEELLRWNRAIRLVGPRDLPGIRIQIADALSPFLLHPPPFPLLDIGTGAGLPAIPIALAHPGASITAVEPLAKRVSFLRHVARSLSLTGLRTVAARAETALDHAPELARAFPAVTARALAAPEEVLTLSRPFLCPNGRVFLLRGPEAAAPHPGWQLLADESYLSPAGTGPRRIQIYRIVP